ncbi:EthD domain-containing protein [Pseudonocardia sp. NPDC049154]|uniref:EthD domain-containing protein n=1 Tax=Pseudonocardia sp. NPDC049154 TaxID=3155501 RepID=UPI0033DE6183
MTGRKLFALLVRRPDLSRSAFSAHWRQIHGPFALQIPGLRRYVQNHVRDWPGPPVAPPPVDGISEAWLDVDGPDDGTGGLHSDPAYLGGARADEPNFLDVTRHDYLRVAEEPVRDGAADGLKVVLLARRRREIEPCRFDEAWTTADVEQRVPGLTRCIRNTVVCGPAAPRPAYDVVDELWWADHESLCAARADPATWASLCRTDVADTAAVHMHPVVLR